VIECVGGPRDGKRLLCPFPSPPTLVFPVLRPPRVIDIRTEPDQPPFVLAQYVAAPGYYEVVFVADDLELTAEVRDAITSVVDNPRQYLFTGK